jgi:hypothetical protein
MSAARGKACRRFGRLVRQRCFQAQFSTLRTRSIDAVDAGWGSSAGRLARAFGDIGGTSGLTAETAKPSKLA